MAVEGIKGNDETRRAEAQERRQDEERAVERRNFREQARDRADKIYESRSERHKQDLEKSRRRAKGEVDATA